MDIGWAKPLIDDSHLGRIYLYPIGTDNVSKEFNLLLKNKKRFHPSFLNLFLLKLTFGEFYMVVVGPD